MKENVILEKSFEFAVRIINLYKYLSFKQNEKVLSKQILRSGTSVGANVEEAIGSISEKEFLMKITIAYKEARETKYWLRLLKRTDFISEEEFQSIVKDNEEILKILASIQITLKNKNRNS
jgi:four helix bundle protein